MRGSDRTRGAYGIITNKSLKKGSIDKYCYDLTYDFLEHLPSKEKNTYLCPKCAKIKNVRFIPILASKCQTHLIE
jgi:hypothetical protein